MAKNYENLNIWKKSIDFASFIYRTTKNFPREEFYGLVSQIRRAVVSISSNIAEGAGRGSKKEFSRFISIASGSLNEVEGQLHIASNLDYIKKEDFEKVLELIKDRGSMLGGFQKFLKK
ncbi:MAG: hypothetical protein A3B99_03710 [Candidatus Yanofskybacteria bacterium RIFCSPHIGHO2_02_FULL_44_12b]|uniref:Four helix bundle protein n=2 Tax=Candidatus Yanofskyibacteriota TaxID=1752733 RepID=A0A1F8GMX2_9BACT|nr:MAG: S23 ribosomal protein [Candidatus Yanofskybacteria bacterium GW2011_GWA2_44_9]OGN04710.1 MAG: hypothetical protein A2659_01130 [Candidatus Yanofskybacteria bacterium RIFCSPHIGHO2_01_FULL_44_24]OGN15626.1 MAG: hypothetical protein A3B99_03710 [Candidatus Yanofskybacteria bacterium RIFCSPHIGHO2_02_FULL_44_12b]OGN26681.1 MAG: hypothetical protein A2925_03795 [Candidatus Yanofskybacteria bacterium RIFCSPLOWO2_01_FULL_44_22]